uniref:Putative secreted protein n=1 Tax=Anopheles marajoara TaxID=58244 RepID=A0A2M4CF40_9DIPT
MYACLRLECCITDLCLFPCVSVTQMIRATNWPPTNRPDRCHSSGHWPGVVNDFDGNYGKRLRYRIFV